MTKKTDKTVTTDKILELGKAARSAKADKISRAAKKAAKLGAKTAKKENKIDKKARKQESDLLEGSGLSVQPVPPPSFPLPVKITIPKKSHSLNDKLGQYFGHEGLLPILLEVALTGKLSDFSMDSQAARTLEQADFIVRFAAPSKTAWGLRPSGRKFLSGAVELVNSAVCAQLTRY